MIIEAAIWVWSLHGQTTKDVQLLSQVAGFGLESVASLRFDDEEEDEDDVGARTENVPGVKADAN